MAAGRVHRLFGRSGGLRDRAAAAVAGGLRLARPVAPVRPGRERLSLHYDAAVRGAVAVIVVSG